MAWKDNNGNWHWDNENDAYSQSGSFLSWNDGKQPIYDANGRWLGGFRNSSINPITYAASSRMGVQVPMTPPTPSVPQPQQATLSGPVTLGSSVNTTPSSYTGEIARTLPPETKSLSWIDRLTGNTYPYSSAQERWNALYPDMPFSSLNADQRINAEHEFLADKALNQASAFQWMTPISFGLDVLGKGLGAWQGFQQLNQAKRAYNDWWNTTRTNFNNQVALLNRQMDIQEDENDAFTGGGAKSHKAKIKEI